MFMLVSERDGDYIILDKFVFLRGGGCCRTACRVKNDAGCWLGWEISFVERGEEEELGKEGRTDGLAVSMAFIRTLE